MERHAGNPDGPGDAVLRKVRQTVSRYGMIRQGDTLVAGVSGGADSMCLLDILHRVREQEWLVVVVAHVHHGLRGEEAERDWRFVQEQASCHGMPFEGVRISPDSYPANTNIQSRARDLRYAFFEKVASKWGAAKIATGHNRDDRVETMLMQLFRGTGTLPGIQPVRDGRYVRPLLEIGRDEISRYLAHRKISFMEDSSNRQSHYTRNRIRRELVPMIRDRINPSFEKTMIQLSNILEEERDCLDEIARVVFERASQEDACTACVVLDRMHLLTLDRAIQRRVIRLAYRRFRGTTLGLSYAQVEEVSRCMDPREGGSHRRFVLHGGVQVHMEYEQIRFSNEDLWSCEPYRYGLSLGIDLPVPEAGATIATCLVSRDDVCPEDLRDDTQVFLSWRFEPRELVVRNFLPGDRFRPAGLGGVKKLKDFFMDRKIPKSRRYRIPLLEIDGVIAWIAGYGVDERFRFSKETPRCLRVSIREGASRSFG